MKQQGCRRAIRLRKSGWGLAWQLPTTPNPTFHSHTTLSIRVPFRRSGGLGDEASMHGTASKWLRADCILL